jgi:hypothetical protein
MLFHGQVTRNLNVNQDVDVPRRQSPEPVWMLFFEVFSDLVIIV